MHVRSFRLSHDWFTFDTDTLHRSLFELSQSREAWTCLQDFHLECAIDPTCESVKLLEDILNNAPCLQSLSLEMRHGNWGGFCDEYIHAEVVESSLRELCLSGTWLDTTECARFLKPYRKSLCKVSLQDCFLSENDNWFIILHQLRDHFTCLRSVELNGC